MRRLERIGWALGGLLLAALAIPWFLWGVDTVVAGLPIWIWWHIGWMVGASVFFWAFTKRGWGLWVEPDFAADADRMGGGNSRPTAGTGAHEGGDHE